MLSQGTASSRPVVIVDGWLLYTHPMHVAADRLAPPIHNRHIAAFAQRYSTMIGFVSTFTQRLLANGEKFVPSHLLIACTPGGCAVMWPSVCTSTLQNPFAVVPFPLIRTRRPSNVALVRNKERGNRDNAFTLAGRDPIGALENNPTHSRSERRTPVCISTPLEFWEFFFFAFCIPLRIPPR